MGALAPPRLRRDDDGSVIIEFAVFAPVLVLLMIGVLQVGIAMQSYNALRNIAGDLSRSALVEAQRGGTPSATDLQTRAGTIAAASPYMLKGNAFTANVTDAATQRVGGARELSVAFTYAVPVVLPLPQWASFPITYSGSIFLLD